MFAKIFSFVLVYILSVINLLIVLLPTVFLFFYEIYRIGIGGEYSRRFIFLAVACTSILMLLFLFFDFLFSYSIRYFKKRCIRCKENDDYGIFYEVFEDVKQKFGKKNVDLYISNSKEINAFAVGGLRQNIIVLTTGILNSYSKQIKDNEQFLTAIKGILGHEMSHIVNKDYFSALLLIVNERAIDFVSRIIKFIFNIFIRIVSIIPLIGGNYLAEIIVKIYNCLDWIINFFYKYVVLKIYDFIQLQISKSIEYRADKQGAKVVGGKNMAFTLSLLGESGYFTIFSSHPSTRSRVKKVKNVDTAEKIRPVFGSNLTFLFSFFIIVYIFVFACKIADLNGLLNEFDIINVAVTNKFYMIKSKIILLINNLANL